MIKFENFGIAYIIIAENIGSRFVQKSYMLYDLN